MKNDNSLKKVRFKYLILFTIFVNAACTSQEYQVTVTSLLEEMLDREALAKVDKYPFKSLQVSSYSRKAVAPDKPGWFDNADAKQYVRVDTINGRKERVLLDVEGPGTIVRFWSTWHAHYFSNGTLRFYFDYSKSPQIEGGIDDLISHNEYVSEPLSKRVSAFLEDGGVFAGNNLYFPLPFAKHCKITYQQATEEVDDVLYYHINYRKYEKGTRVKTYQKGDWESEKYKSLIGRVNAQLNQFPPDDLQNEVTSMTRIVKRGESTVILLEGSKAIKKLSLKIGADNLSQALRSTVITMEFDGKPTVWAPLGDFFGTGYKISAYQSRYSTVNNDGEMITYFPMPFRESAKVTLHNYGKEDVELIKFDLHSSPWHWDEQSLYFHANWRLYSDIETAEKKDVNYVTISGKGKYVGDVLTLFNNSYEWWGEGDEKIYVDEEKFPSHFGTGTEDYYGYAWCSVVDFDSPFIAQPIGDGNRSPGISVNSRWRMLDVIPFDKSLKFDMELWHWGNTHMDYAPTTFWYGTKEAKAKEFDHVSAVQLPVKHADKFEGESFEVKEMTGGEVLTQAFLSYEWSARNHLYWKGIKKEDTLETFFYSEKDREGKLEAVFTHAPEYIILDMYLNGQRIFENLDLYSDSLNLKKYTVDNGYIKKGNNTVLLVAKGGNKKSPKADQLGFDYLKVHQ
ncbi:DUF2961 domain-containing protein [Fulvivirgaceae bacterium BMA12]|uniref:DUF2961 domain-containing protein n=1 Tax=Agaribacillus aureus TaxID=3051825 RepID=A0ABT8LJ04_9BACT|nr:DUF2961 domain-containing protein [Fulvivirgaceae bacterium BMA12]